MYDLTINQWAAWAPGITHQDDWRKWNEGSLTLGGDEQADVGFLPPMQRRRLGTIARAVVHVIFSCSGRQCNVPVIYGSLHGEIHRTFKLLQTIATDQPVSPMDFSLGVHNAVAGLVSMAMENRAPSICLSPGDQGMVNAIIEAIGVLYEESWESVLVVLYDEPLPEYYRPFTESVELPVSLAFEMQLAGSKADGQRFSLERHTGSDIPTNKTIIGLIEFLVQERDLIKFSGEEDGWTLRRHR